MYDERNIAELIPMCYDELRSLARVLMRTERKGHTLQTTALVNETVLRILKMDRCQFDDLSAFFAMAADSMRRVLVDHARKFRTRKRGGDLERVPFEALENEMSRKFGHPRIEILELDQALDRLAARHPRKAEVIKLMFFAGLDQEETARALHVSPRTVRYDWTFARVWLIREMQDAPSAGPSQRRATTLQSTSGQER
jgi:RNA polymerase sigma factor (TIGR02999 family)